MTNRDQTPVAPQCRVRENPNEDLFQLRHLPSVLEFCTSSMPRSGTESSLKKRRLRLDDDFDNPMHQFQLLRSAGCEQSVDALSDVARVFFSFQHQQDARLQAQSLCHRHYRVKTRDLVPTFNVAPEVACYVAALCGFFKA